MSVSDEPDPDWYGYECKPGQILFYYNKTTGEHIWAGGDVSKYIKCEPVDDTDREWNTVNTEHGCLPMIDGSGDEDTHSDSRGTTKVLGEDVQTHNNGCTKSSIDETTAMQGCPTSEPDSDAPEKSDVSKREVDDGMLEYQEQRVQELDTEMNCKLCDAIVHTTDEYYHHLKTHCAEKSRKCPVCQKTFKGRRSFFIHLRNYSQGKQCRTPSARGLKMLAKMNTCSTCNKAFKNHRHRKIHERIHTDERPYKCTYCNKAFALRSYQEKHERIHSGVKPYKCTYCNKAFARRDYQEKHERIHTGVKPYKCTYCNKAYTQEYGLKQHQRIHTGVKPYKCTHCNKTFTRHDSQKQHERIHTGFKPYKCTHCNQAFTRHDHQRKHERIHTGERPYKGTHCNKAFSQNCNLKQHEIVHTTVKPMYICTHCNKTFRRQYDLEQHERIHTK